MSAPTAVHVTEYGDASSDFIQQLELMKSLFIASDARLREYVNKIQKEQASAVEQLDVLTNTSVREKETLQQRIDLLAQEIEDVRRQKAFVLNYVSVDDRKGRLGLDGAGSRSSNGIAMATTELKDAKDELKSTKDILEKTAKFIRDEKEKLHKHEDTVRKSELKRSEEQVSRQMTTESTNMESANIEKLLEQLQRQYSAVDDEEARLEKITVDVNILRTAVVASEQRTREYLAHYQKCVQHIDPNQPTSGIGFAKTFLWNDETKEEKEGEAKEEKSFTIDDSFQPEPPLAVLSLSP